MTLTDEEFHHLTRVMRSKEEDLIEIVNGKDQIAMARITSIKKSSALAYVTKVTDYPAPSHQLILVQALTRLKNLDLIIEKGTELGASSFYLFPGERSELKELSPHQLQRLRKLTISALKQCKRLDLPNIEIAPGLGQWESPPSGQLFFADINGKRLSEISPLGTKEKTFIFVGPEKGFTDEEKKLLTSSFNATALCLNRNVLRAETAAICALSLLTYACAPSSID